MMFSSATAINDTATTFGCLTCSSESDVSANATNFSNAYANGDALAALCLDCQAVSMVNADASGNSEANALGNATSQLNGSANSMTDVNAKATDGSDATAIGNSTTQLCQTPVVLIFNGFARHGGRAAASPLQMAIPLRPCVWAAAPRQLWKLLGPMTATPRL